MRHYLIGTDSVELTGPITWDGLIVDTGRSVGATTEMSGQRLKVFVEDADIPHLEMVRFLSASHLNQMI